MTPADILTRVRYITKTSTGDGSGDTDSLLALLNDFYFRFATVLIDTNEDLFGVKMKTTLSLNANQEGYYMPATLMRLKRVEVTYDGTNWYPVTLADDNEWRGIAMDPVSIGNNFSQSQPYANWFGNILYLRPIPAQTVSLGLRIYGICRPTLLSNISLDNINIPAEYHGYLVYGMSGEVATRQGDEALAAAMFQKWEDGQNKARQMFAPRELNYLAGFRQTPNSYT